MRQTGGQQPASGHHPPPVITSVVDEPSATDFGVQAPPIPPRPPAAPPVALSVTPAPATTREKRRPRIRLGFRVLIPRSLTARLVCGVVALIFVLVSVVGSATYYSLKPFLIGRLSQQVSSLANNQPTLNQYTGGSSTFSMSGPLDIWLGLLNPDGSVVQASSSVSTTHVMNLSHSDAEAVLAHPTRTRELTATDGTELVVQASPLVFRGAPNATLVVGLSAAGVHDTLHRLIVLEVLLGVAAVLLAALLTSWGVRAGLRPLIRVSRTAQEVTAELGPDGAGLQRRVPGPEDDSEVGQVASSMNRLLEAIQAEFTARLASEERMRQFLADASHELRTPLTSIRGYAELSLT